MFKKNVQQIPNFMSYFIKNFAPKLLVISLLFITLSCGSDDDPIPPTPPSSGDDSLLQKDFIWKGLNLWYFWQAQVPSLADNRFSNTTDYNNYLKGYNTPEDLFNSLLYKSSEDEDRFSYMSDNYKDIVSAQQGISKSNGLEFNLYKYSNSDGVYGVVRYILPNSNAASKTIQRGDIFIGVNGTDLSVSNYSSLLFGDNDTYTLNMGEISQGAIAPNNKTVTLTKEAGLQEDPIFIKKVFTEGSKKIGYLMYNQFVADYNKQLNDAFGFFKTEGVTDLVLDFRYNPGGSVNTSRLLASMVYGTNTNQLFIKQRWNSKIQPQLSKEQLEDYFAATVDGTTPINTLNLNKVYIIITRGSASASELVINGLNPYIDVELIGSTSRGKNEFSITLVDDKDNSYIYTKNREGNINPKNQYAMQPLVGRNENSAGFYDYTAGFTPDIELGESLSNMGVLGEKTEPLLARAIAEITGQVPAARFNTEDMIEQGTYLGSSLEGNPIKENMILDKPIRLQK